MKELFFKSLTSVELTFENLDQITIPVSYFTELDIRMSPHRTADSLTADYVRFSLKPEADASAPLFTGDVFGLQEGECSLFSRLQQQDITFLTLIRTDAPPVTICPLWAEHPDNPYRNRLQSASFTDTGSLCVQIQEVAE